jgi:hypothetical protein
MVALLYLPLHLGIALGIGWLLVQRRDGVASLYLGERLAVAPLVGLVVLYYAVQAVGMVRLDVWSMAMTMMVLGALAMLGLRALPRAAIAQRVCAVMLALRQDRWFAVLATMFCVIGVTSLLQGMAPPNDYDSLMYHISGPKFDIESGRIDMPWNRGLPHFLFPALMGNQTRLALALSDADAAQMIHGSMGIVASVLTALLMRRLGYSRRVALSAAILLITTRVVVWQMGTVEIEVPLAAFAVAAMILYMVLRRESTLGVGLLFGMMIGAMLLTKLHGFALALAFGPVILYDVWRTKRVAPYAVGPLLAAVMFIPHSLRVYVLTGNPIFPIVNNLFQPGSPDFFSEAYSAYGIGGGASALWLTPWFMFIEPMKYFDGMIFGLPIFLALAPLLILEGGVATRWLWLAGIAVIYYLIWLVAFGQQVRFLLPLMPLFAGWAAAGAAAMWDASARMRLARYGFVIILSLMIVGQSMFVGIYSVLRLPVAVGLVSERAYHGNTPTLGGAHFETCRYIEDNLEPGRRYLSFMAPLSFYCPQRAAVVNYFDDEAKWWMRSRTKPALSFEEFLERFEKASFSYVLLPTGWISRRNINAEEHTLPVDPMELRFGPEIYRAVSSLKPLATDGLSAVYDGPAVLAELRHQRLGSRP